jgi:hypothetical protein
MEYTAGQLAGLTYREVPAGGYNELLLCDGNCRKAWGINHRPKIEFSDVDPDDYAFLPDSEVGEAPADPGTYEGGHAKPRHDAGPNRQNKWCLRECERSISLAPGEAFRLPNDFLTRVYNMKSRRLLEEGL